MCRVLAEDGRGAESLQAISRLLGSARMTAKCERSLTLCDAVSACSHLYYLACCTKVTFTCRQGRTAASQILFLRGGRFSFHGSHDGKALKALEGVTCCLHYSGVFNSWATSLADLKGRCTASFTCILSPFGCMNAHGKGRKSP